MHNKVKLRVSLKSEADKDRRSPERPSKNKKTVREPLQSTELRRGEHDIAGTCRADSESADSADFHFSFASEYVNEGQPVYHPLRYPGPCIAWPPTSFSCYPIKLPQVIDSFIPCLSCCDL